MIPHNDIAQAHGNTNAPGTLDLRTADFDSVIVPEILFDRRCKPRRHDIEIHRPGTEPQPQGTKRRTENNAEGHQNDRNPTDPAITSSASAAKPAKPIREAVNADAWTVEKLDRPIAGGIVMVIPSGILPMPVLVCSLC